MAEKETFGPYAVQELIGRGGMGEVHRAFDTRKNNRVVALKRLPSALTGDEEFERRFMREARLAADLSDPHVIPIHDYGEIDGRPYLDMRYVDGRDLGALLRDEGPLAPGRAVDILGQLASALDDAHDRGLVHRDVKPANVLVSAPRSADGDGRDFVYLIDFGIAAAAADARLTSSDVTVGTAAYMAPERFSGRGDHRVDVYALGCVLYEMLTARAPFPGADYPQLVRAHLEDPPPRVPGGVTALDDVVARALAKDPDGRPGRAGRLAAEARGAVRAMTASVPTSPERAGGIVTRPAAVRPGANGPGVRASGVNGSGATPPVAPPMMNGIRRPQAGPPLRPAAPTWVPHRARYDQNPRSRPPDTRIGPPATADERPGAAPTRRRFRRILLVGGIVAAVLVASAGVVVAVAGGDPTVTLTARPEAIEVGPRPLGTDVGADGSVHVTVGGAGNGVGRAVAVIGPQGDGITGPIAIPVDGVPGIATAARGGTPPLIPIAAPPLVARLDTDGAAGAAATALNVSNAGSPQDLEVLGDGRAFAVTLAGSSVSVVQIDPAPDRLGMLGNPVPIAHPLTPSGTGLFSSPDGTALHVIVAGPGGSATSAIATVDPGTRAVLSVHPVPAVVRDGAAHPDGSRVFLAETEASGVTVLDVVTGAVSRFDVGPRPTAVALSSDGEVLYVAHDDGGTDTGRLAALDADTGRVLGSVLVGTKPRDVALAPDGSRAYVTNMGSGSVSVVDIAR